MHLKVKTLKGVMVEVPAEAATLVSELKTRIEGALPSGEAPADCQRLIHKGKEMEDARTVGSYEVQEQQDFLVVMVRKKRPADVAFPAAPSPAPAPAPAPAQDTAATAAAATAAAAAPAPASAPASAPAPAPAPAGPPPELVAQIKEMGFPESQVVAALRAAGNDPTVAIEFLFSGNIPASPAPDAGAATAGGAGAGAGAATAGGGANAAAIAQFLSSPHFDELRRLVRDSPSDLEAAVGALASTNPDLVRLLNDDPNAFWEALLGAEGMGDEEDDEDDDDDDDEDDEGEDVDEAAAEAAAVMAASGATLAAEDEAAITRLQEMGFDREQAVQAYLLAGKDENMAVNLLLGG